MKAILVTLLMICCLGPGLACSEDLVLPWGLTFHFEVPPDGWRFSAAPPDFLVAARTADAQAELAAGGKSVDPARLEAAVAKRLGEDEGFVFHPASKALLEIDFSPLRKDEDPPGEKTLADSARYAMQELEGEGGVAGFDGHTRKIEFPGLALAYRIDATFTMDGEPRKFLGIVGYQQPCWVFLYYTDPLANPGDFPAMEKMLGTARIAPKQ